MIRAKAGIFEERNSENPAHDISVSENCLDRYHIVRDGDLKEAARKLSEVQLVTDLITVTKIPLSKANASL